MYCFSPSRTESPPGSDGKESVTLEVRDTGVGIDPEDLQRLFGVEPAISRTGTRGEKGSGLGLLLAREYVVRNGGSIRATSEPRKGSVFTVTLPAAPGE